MSQTAHIMPDEKWHIYERKFIDIRVFDASGDPADLTGLSLTWKVARTRHGFPVYLEKEGLEVAPVPHETDDYGASVARIGPIVEEDYALFPGPGVWRHELRDMTNDLVLSEGEAHLLPAMAPEAAS